MVASRAEVAELRAVAAYADRHRVTAAEWLTRGALSREGRDMVWDLDDHPTKAAELSHEAGDLGTEGILRLAGEGAFSVREFAVTDLAVTLELSEHSARAYVAQAVELRDRLPRLWSQVMSGRLPVWKARRIAEQTIPLKAATAGFVDDQLAEFAHRISLTRITRCVEAAIIRHQPDLARRRRKPPPSTAASGWRPTPSRDSPRSPPRWTHPMPTPSTGPWTRPPPSSAPWETTPRVTSGAPVRSGCSPTRSTPWTCTPPPPPRPSTAPRS